MSGDTQAQATGHAQEQVDERTGGGGDEVGAPGIGYLDGRESAERPEQDFLGVAVDRTSAEAVAQLVQQHREEEQAHDQGRFVPVFKDMLKDAPAKPK